MKKLLLLFAAIAFMVSASAQTKTAYLDLYQRGGGQHLRTTILVDGRPIYLGRANIGEVLNFLGGLGWQVDMRVDVRRLGLWLTRHKFHIILKKEYRAEENPFDGLRSFGDNSGSTQIADGRLVSTQVVDGRLVINDELIYEKTYLNRKDIFAITLTSNVKFIGPHAFYGCENLREIYCESVVPPTLSNWNAFYLIDSNAVIYVPNEAVETYKNSKNWKSFKRIIKGY